MLGLRSASLGFVIVLCISAGAAPPVDLTGVQVVRVPVPDEGTWQVLLDLERTGVGDVEVWRESAQGGGVEVRVTPAGRLLLDAWGLGGDVLVEDLQRELDHEARAGAGRDFFSVIRTYEEHIQFMTELAAAYPQLAQMFDLGLSVEGRHMYGLRITGPGRVKPAILYHGAQHGNERAAAMILQYVANNLLTRYATDPAIRELVDHAEWCIVPMSNPDGYVRNTRYNVHGVDLNRNWGGPGSGQDPTGGPYPFSEPETQHLRDLMLATPNMRIELDLHGYTNKLMFPWGHKNQTTPHHATYTAVTNVCRDAVAAAGGGAYDTGIIYTTLYEISGGAADYAYGELGLWAWLWEVRNSQVPTICQHFLNALLHLGTWIWSYDCNANGYADSEDIALGRSSDWNHNSKPDECDGLGDVNCDAVLDFFDINPFVLALTDPAGYAQQYPGCPMLHRDINGDGQVSFLDINPFVALLAAE